MIKQLCVVLLSREWVYILNLGKARVVSLAANAKRAAFINFQTEQQTNNEQLLRRVRRYIIYLYLRPSF